MAPLRQLHSLLQHRATPCPSCRAMGTLLPLTAGQAAWTPGTTLTVSCAVAEDRHARALQAYNIHHESYLHLQAGAPGFLASRQSCHGPTVPLLQSMPGCGCSARSTCAHRNRRSSDELGSCGGSAEGKEQPSQADKAGSADDTGLRTSTGGGSGGQDSSRTKLGSRAQTSTSPDPAAGKDGTLVSGPAVHSAGPHQGTAAQAAAAAPLSRAGPVGGAAGSAHRPSCTGQSAAGGAGAGIAGTAGAGGQVAEVQPASGRQPGSEGQAAGAGADPTPAAGEGSHTMQGIGLRWAGCLGGASGVACTVPLCPVVSGNARTV